MILNKRLYKKYALSAQMEGAMMRALSVLFWTFTSVGSDGEADMRDLFRHFGVDHIPQQTDGGWMSA